MEVEGCVISVSGVEASSGAGLDVLRGGRDWSEKIRGEFSYGE